MPSTMYAGVRLPAIVGDHMMLQQQIGAPIWGWADPGETVTVT
jgi:sialate O-acetylesterase